MPRHVTKTSYKKGVVPWYKKLGYANVQDVPGVNKRKGIPAKSKAEIAKAWRLRHPEKAKQIRQDNYKNHRQAYLERSKRTRERNLNMVNGLKKQCLICGEHDYRCLVFHHRPGTTKCFTIGASLCLNLERILKEIDKCDVLCANCHSKIHYERKGNSANAVEIS